MTLQVDRSQGARCRSRTRDRLEALEEVVGANDRAAGIDNLDKCRQAAHLQGTGHQVAGRHLCQPELVDVTRLQVARQSGSFLAAGKGAGRETRPLAAGFEASFSTSSAATCSTCWNIRTADRYAGQRIFAVQRENYVYLVPFVEEEITVFLKTIIPSRNATKQDLG